MSQDKLTRETIAKQISIEFGIAYSTVYKKIDKILEIWSNTMINSDLSINYCLLYTSDAADDMQCVDLGGRRIIKKKFDFLSIFKIFVFIA